MSHKQKSKKLDFSKFQTISNICNQTLNNQNNQNKIVSICTYLERVAIGLKYYQMICKHLDQNKSSQDLMVQFATDTYEITMFLDDFTHVIKAHGEDLMLIASVLNNQYGLKQCDVMNCNILQRHYRISDKPNENYNNAAFSFISESYDRCHHHIFHLYALGLRTDNVDINDIEADTVNTSFIDKAFQQRKTIISSKQKQSGLELQRLKNKYNLHIGVPTHILDKDTFLDGMYRFIKNGTDIPNTEFNSLVDFISLNEYDSDAIQGDLDNLVFAADKKVNMLSNIYNRFKNSFFIPEYSGIIQLSASKFSTGFVFYYWPYYKTLSEDQVMQDDALDKYTRLNGYSIKDLIVSEYFSSFKEEIFSSGFVTLRKWNAKIFRKANCYYATLRVKRIRAHRRAAENNHGFQMGDPIGLNHLISIICYCDVSELQCDFTTTFRKTNPFESIESLKKRHMKYFHFAKNLVESVTNFGINGFREDSFQSDETDEKNETFAYKYETGPFYFGLKVVVNVPEFAIYVKGPCSTTKELSVAINFSTVEGLILNLQNDIGRGVFNRFFDCSWISLYSDEDERLFIYGDRKIRIASIIARKTNENYEQYCAAFYLFDYMLSAHGVGTVSHQNTAQQKLRALTREKKVVATLRDAINEVLHGTTQTVSHYMTDSFRLFINAKRQIEINMYELDKYFKKINDLVIQQLDFQVTDFKDENLANILNMKTLSIFPNLNKVTLNTTCDYPHYVVYRFNLLSFLSAIEFVPAYRAVQYVIKAEEDDEEQPTWLCNIITASITAAFKEKGWNIALEKEDDETDCLIINRM